MPHVGRPDGGSAVSFLVGQLPRRGAGRVPRMRRRVLRPSVLGEAGRRVEEGRTVAQVRVIFVPDYLDPSIPRVPLAYVQPFKLAPGTRGKTDPETNMYRLKRELRSDKSRKGVIVPLAQIWRPVELIPVFGRRCNTEWTCDTAVEESLEFYLNSFPDKATYIMVY